MKRALFALLSLSCAPRAKGAVERDRSQTPAATTVAIAQSPRARREEPSPGVELAFVGDVMFGRYRPEGFREICGARCPSPSALFDDVRPLLRADLAVANLETPVVRTLPALAPIDTQKVFGATPAQLALLRDAGFDALSVANNHWFDQRFDGVIATPALVREGAMLALGEAVTRPPWVRAVTVDRRSVSLAFIAFTSVLNKPLVAGRPMVQFVAIEDIERRVTPVVRAAHSRSDVVVVLAHWGVEYQREPLASQVSAARALIDAGATMVIGHHPHVLQRIERYRSGIIAYSLGNFLFDNAEQAQRETGVLRVRAGRDGVVRAEFVPVWIDDQPVFHPVRARGERAHRINRSVLSLSIAPLAQARDEALYWD